MSIDNQITRKITFNGTNIRSIEYSTPDHQKYSLVVYPGTDTNVSHQYKLQSGVPVTLDLQEITIVFSHTDTNNDDKVVFRVVDCDTKTKVYDDNEALTRGYRLESTLALTASVGDPETATVVIIIEDDPVDDTIANN